MTEGVYPKVDGDILYASESNDLQFCYSSQFTSATEVTHTGDTSYTTKKTITVAGGYSGYRLVFLSWAGKIDSNADGNLAYSVLVNGRVINETSTISGATFVTDETTYTVFSVPIMVNTGDVIIIQIKLPASGRTGYIKDAKIWSTAPDATFS